MFVFTHRLHGADNNVFSICFNKWINLTIPWSIYLHFHWFYSCKSSHLYLFTNLPVFQFVYFLFTINIFIFVHLNIYLPNYLFNQPVTRPIDLSTYSRMPHKTSISKFIDIPSKSKAKRFVFWNIHLVKPLWPRPLSCKQRITAVNKRFWETVLLLWWIEQVI